MKDPQEFAETLKADLFEDEVFVFTPKGEVKSLAAGATPLDFAYEIHTDVGHRCVGAKVNGKIVPLHYELQSGDICEVLTSKKERGPSRDWLALAKTTRAQSKIRAWFKRERREDSERTGREILHENLKRAGPAAAEDRRLAAARRRDPRDGLQEGRGLLHRARPGEDLGQDRHPEADAAAQGGRVRGREPSPRRRAARARARRRGRPAASSTYGIKVEGVRGRDAAARQVLPAGAGRPDRRLHLARQGHHDPPRGLPERAGADEEPGALHRGGLGGRRRRPSFRVELQVDGWDRPACSRTCRATFAETGINILEARCTVVHPMVKNRFVVEADAPAQGGRGRGARLRRGASCSSGARRPRRPRPRRLRDQGAGRRRRDAAAGEVLPPGSGRRDRRLHLARARASRSTTRLPERRRR